MRFGSAEQFKFFLFVAFKDSKLFFKSFIYSIKNSPFVLNGSYS